MVKTPMALTPRQKEAARRIGYGESYKEVAEALSVDLSTMYKWARRDDFVALVSRECDRCLMALKPKLRKILEEQLDTEPGWLRSDALKLAYQRQDKIEGVTDNKVTISFGAIVADPGVPDTGESDVDTGQTDE